MAGLDPAIHLLQRRLFAKKMDTRVKPAYDASDLDVSLRSQ
jgi:hypothetical protein